MIERSVDSDGILKKLSENRLVFFLMIFTAVLLIFNIFITGYMFNIISTQYPGRSAQFNHKQYVAVRMLDYNRRLATDMDVSERSSVKEALADFSYDIEVASSRDDLTQVILTYPRRVQDIILQEWEDKFQDEVLSAVNEDPDIQGTREYTRFTMRLSEEEIRVEPFDILSDSTLSRIMDLPLYDDLDREHIIEVEVVDGEARNVVEESPEDYIQLLSEEVNSLRVALRELRISSGYSEMTGSGIVVRMYDQEDAVDNPSIVHDTDIRDVVNELFAAGAKGIAVGNQRLTATSSIRCTGPLVKVDDKLVSVNPVEIKVVGDPRLLANGMDIIKNTMERDRGLNFDMERVDNITLPAYSRD